MPWTEKQMRLFRAAAHDKEISKRTGIKQSDARRMMNEGVKKASGGVLKQAVGKKDTKHGLLDLPVAKERTMKKPKMRFAGGGKIDFKKWEKERNEWEKDHAQRLGKFDYEFKGQAPSLAANRDRAFMDNLMDRVAERNNPLRRSWSLGESGGTAEDEDVKFKKGGVVRCRDGCAVRGKTRGTIR